MKDFERFAIAGMHSVKLNHFAVLTLGAATLFSSAGLALAQKDPGVRPEPINGQEAATATSRLPLPSVAVNSPTGALEFLQNGLARFQEVEVVSNGTNNGLGPRFNMNQCSACHAQPTIGGTRVSSNHQLQGIADGIAVGSLGRGRPAPDNAPE